MAKSESEKTIFELIGECSNEAPKKEDLQALKQMIDKNPGILKTKNIANETPTIFAATFGITEIIKLFIDKDKTVLKDKDENGYTPAIIAA